MTAIDTLKYESLLVAVPENVLSPAIKDFKRHVQMSSWLSPDIRTTKKRAFTGPTRSATKPIAIRPTVAHRLTMVTVKVESYGII